MDYLGIELNTFEVAVGSVNHCTIQVATEDKSIFNIGDTLFNTRDFARHFELR
jgi:hypothetical protein